MGSNKKKKGGKKKKADSFLGLLQYETLQGSKVSLEFTIFVKV